ncbi:hypothetical protein N9B36_01680, partial [Akkermansiaceae bacterium]|nr:hypothetical protein [Akkermansiaceae bacterium]
PSFAKLAEQLAQIKDAIDHKESPGEPLGGGGNKRDIETDQAQGRDSHDSSLAESERKSVLSEKDTGTAGRNISDLEEDQDSPAEELEVPESKIDQHNDTISKASYEKNLAELSDTRRQLEEAQSELKILSGDSEREKIQLEDELESCKAQIELFRNEKQAAESEVETLEGRVCELDEAKAQCEDRVTKITLELQKAAEKSETLARDRDTLEDRTSEMEQQKKVSRKLDQLIWPDFMEKAEMKEWKGRLQDALDQDQTDDNVIVIIANLFNFNAFCGLGDKWTRRLIDVLQDFSRALFAWCERFGLEPEQAVSQANLWAEQFSVKGEGGFEIEVPGPDEPFDQRVMVSFETGNMSGSRDVKSVKTWCIKDGSGRILKQAEVTTA